MAGGTIVVGTITQDFVTSPVCTLDGQLGGSATYFALAARHFGPVSVIGTVGKDRAVDLHLALSFADLSLVTISETGTYTWRARRDNLDGDATTLERFEGAYRDYRPELGSTDAWPQSLFLASTDPEIQLAVATKANRSSIIGGDTMDIFVERQRPAVMRMLGHLRFLTVTQTELELISATKGIAAGAMRLMNEHPALAAIFVKRGPSGVVLWTRDRTLRLPAYPVTVVDPTGAGDAFAGALMGRLGELQSLAQSALEEAARWGVVAASYAIEEPGITALAAATRPGMEARLEQFRALEMHPRESGDRRQE